MRSPLVGDDSKFYNIINYLYTYFINNTDVLNIYTFRLMLAGGNIIVTFIRPRNDPRYESIHSNNQKNLDFSMVNRSDAKDTSGGFFQIQSKLANFFVLVLQLGCQLLVRYIHGLLNRSVISKLVYLKHFYKSY